MKKLILIPLVCVIFLSACGREEKKPLMDELAEDGRYHYENKDLGFGIALPEEFIYYQTQKRDFGNAIVLEVFVPTSDQAYPQEIQSYAKPVIIALFEQEYWDSLSDNQDEKMFYKEMARKNGKVYGLSFWNKVPADWQEIWNQGYQSGIEDSFYLIE